MVISCLSEEWMSGNLLSVNHLTEIDEGQGAERHQVDERREGDLANEAAGGKAEAHVQLLGKWNGHGNLGIWRFGNLEIWEFGNLGIWGIWKSGDLGIWESGNLGIWESGTLPRFVRFVRFRQISRFPDFQIPRFPNSQISRFPDFQIPKFPNPPCVRSIW